MEILKHVQITRKIVSKSECIEQLTTYVVQDLWYIL